MKTIFCSERDYLSVVDQVEAVVVVGREESEDDIHREEEVYNVIDDVGPKDVARGVEG